ncbi:9268_t:CDS:1, partial [Dentiscutata heterogama]
QLKDSYIKAKAKGIVRRTVLNLASKKLTLSQLLYLNNICIISKLCYMLQISRLSKEALKEIHRPMLKLIKNKMELQISTENFILKHKSLGNCQALDEELFAKQTLSLLK